MPYDEEADVEDTEAGGGGMHVHDMHLGEGATPAPPTSHASPAPPAAEPRAASPCAPAAGRSCCVCCPGVSLTALFCSPGAEEPVPRRRAEGAAAPSYAQAAARRSVPAATAVVEGTAPAGARQAADAVASAAAIAGLGGEHKLRFSLGSVQLSQSSTIFQAIQSGQRSRQAAASSAAGDGEEALPAPQARRLWDEVHTVHFCRCAAGRPCAWWTPCSCHQSVKQLIATGSAPGSSYLGTLGMNMSHLLCHRLQV